MSEQRDGHFWKEDGEYRAMVIWGHQCYVDFRAPSWRALKRTMRECGVEPATIREKDLKEEWHMPSGEFLAMS